MRRDGDVRRRKREDGERLESSVNRIKVEC